MRPHAHTNPRLPASPGRLAARYGLLCALALTAAYLEALLPLPVTVPGVKLGLGNAVVLFALLSYGSRCALAVMLAKVCCATLLFASPQMFVFSLAGGLCSWAIMTVAARWKLFSEVGISVLGGVAHNAGQLLAVGFVLSWQVAAINAPILIVAGVLCGAGIGLVLRAVMRMLPLDGGLDE